MSRRRASRPPDKRRPFPTFTLGRTERIAAAVLAVGVAAILLAVLVTRGGGSDNGVAQPTTTSGPLPSASGAVLQPADADSQAIINLARKSIEVLPQGQWPSLYGDFTQAFHARCSQDEFNQAGVASGINLGTDLPLLAFKFIHDVTISGDTAKGTIVAEVTGKYEYQVNAAFAREDGIWKIAPDEGTSGCSAFNVLS